MRIWLIGAGTIGMNALYQLQKNPDIEVIVSDPSPDPVAVREGLIAKVDYIQNVTPVNINTLAHRIRPDLILLSPTAGSGNGLGSMEGGQALTDALNYEIISSSEYPCLILSHSNKL